MSLQAADIDQPRLEIPEVNLWISVLCLCLKDIQECHDSADEAYEWIRDPQNLFLPWIAGSLDFPPDKFRKKLIELAKKGM